MVLFFFVQNCFELYIPNNRGQLIKACKTEADGRVVEGNHMVYRISAPTPEEKDEWIHSIKWVNRWMKVSEDMAFERVKNYLHQEWPDKGAQML